MCILCLTTRVSSRGTGKSLALLCAALAWQRRVASTVSSMEGSTGTVPQIVYGVACNEQKRPSENSKKGNNELRGL